MSPAKIYGLDLGGRQCHVSVDGQLGEGYDLEKFLDFEWYEGPGSLYTENSTFFARPTQKTASLAQYATCDQWWKFQNECKAKGVIIYVFPHKHTWKIVRQFMTLVQKNHPSVSQYQNIDFSRYKLDSKGKYKDDDLEALILAWYGEQEPQKFSRLKSIRDPDAEWDSTSQIKHAIVNQSNRRLNNQRVTNMYDDLDFSRLRDLLEKIELKILSSHHPGAEILRKINAIPRAHKKSTKYSYDKGDIKIHEISPIFKSVYSCRVDEQGKLYPFGFQMLWKVLGGSAYRYKSGVAGAQLRYDVHKQIRNTLLQEAGLNPDDNYCLLTRDPDSPYYKIQRQAHKDLKNAVKFVNKTLENLLNYD